MRLHELIESQDVVQGQKFYHVTTKNRVRSIMATGLEPRRNRRWRNQLGGILGERGFIYLISDFTQAVRFAARQAYGFRLKKSKMETVILVLQNVPTEGLVRDDHIDGQLAGHTWFKSPATIPPQDIVRIIPLTPELTKQAVIGSTAEEPPADPAPETAANPSMV
jgi:hypothetical protein